MSREFKHLFDEATLKSEKLRILILTALFSSSVVYITIMIAFFRETVSVVLDHRSLQTLLILQLSLTAFEGACLLFVIRRQRRNQGKVPVWMQYVNTTVELTFPVVLMYLLSAGMDRPAHVLHSPVSNSYFLFIILSTLRLNFRLSVYSGILGAVQYMALSVYFLSSGDLGVTMMDSYLIHLSKALTIFFGGVAAGFVARQIGSNIAQSLEESERKKQVMHLFRQQLSTSVADNMIMGGGSLESRRVHAGVMFIDIRDFTRYVSDKSPEEIVQYQNAFFRIAIESIEKHGGVINQFLGDGCMATFGAPVSLENPGRNAVDAALEINERVDAEVNKGSLPLTRIGVGIHCGDVVAGNIGTETRRQYSITGGVVIMASRIEQLNKNFGSQILVSEDVVKQLNGRASAAENMGKICLKGYEQPVSIFKLA